MANRANRISAALCGAATIVAFGALHTLLPETQLSGKVQEVILFIASPLVVFIPAFVFVWGARFFPPEATDVLIDTSGVGSIWDVIGRMLCWLAGGAIAGTLFHALQRAW